MQERTELSPAGRVSRRAMLGRAAPAALGSLTAAVAGGTPASAEGTGDPFLQALRPGDELLASRQVSDPFGIARLRVTAAGEQNGLARYTLDLLSGTGENRGTLLLAVEAEDDGAGAVTLLSTAALSLPGRPAITVAVGRTLGASGQLAAIAYAEVEGARFSIAGLGSVTPVTADPVRTGPVYQEHTLAFRGKSTVVRQGGRSIPSLPVTAQELRDHLTLRQKLEQFTRSSGARTFLKTEGVRLALTLLQDEALVRHLPLLERRLAQRETAVSERGRSWILSELEYVAAINTFLSL